MKTTKSSAGSARRDRGVAKVTAHNRDWVERAKLAAVKLGREPAGVITADMVRHAMGADLPKHPNAFGAVFRDRRFRWSGSVIKSIEPSRHRGIQRIWTLAK